MYNKTTKEADKSFVGRKEALEDYLQTIAAGIQAGNVSRIDRGLIVNRLSSFLGLDTQELETELRRRTKRLRQRTSAPSSGTGAKPPLDVDHESVIEREILEILLNEPSQYANIKSLVTVENFKSGMLREAAKIIFDAYENAPDITLAEILARVESMPLAQLITSLAYEGQAKGNFSARLAGVREVMQLQMEQKQMVQEKLPQLDIASPSKGHKKRPYKWGLVR